MWRRRKIGLVSSVTVAVVAAFWNHCHFAVAAAAATADDDETRSRLISDAVSRATKKLIETSEWQSTQTYNQLLCFLTEQRFQEPQLSFAAAAAKRLHQQNGQKTGREHLRDQLFMRLCRWDSNNNESNEEYHLLLDDSQFQSLHPSDAMIVLALFCDVRPLSTDFQDKYASPMLQHESAYGPSHVLLVMLLLQERKCPRPLSAEFEQDVIRKNIHNVQQALIEWKKIAAMVDGNTDYSNKSSNSQQQQQQTLDEMLEAGALLLGLDHSHVDDDDESAPLSIMMILQDLTRVALETQNSDGSWGGDGTRFQWHTTMLGWWYLMEVQRQRRMQPSEFDTTTEAATPGNNEEL